MPGLLPCYQFPSPTTARQSKLNPDVPGSAFVWIVNCVLVRVSTHQKDTALVGLFVGVICTLVGVVASPWDTTIAVLPDVTDAVPEFSVMYPVFPLIMPPSFSPGSTYIFAAGERSEFPETMHAFELLNISTKFAVIPLGSHTLPCILIHRLY